MLRRGLCKNQRPKNDESASWVQPHCTRLCSVTRSYPRAVPLCFLFPWRLWCRLASLLTFLRSGSSVATCASVPADTRHSGPADLRHTSRPTGPLRFDRQRATGNSSPCSLVGAHANYNLAIRTRRGGHSDRRRWRGHQRGHRRQAVGAVGRAAAVCSIPIRGRVVWYVGLEPVGSTRQGTHVRRGRREREKTRPLGTT